MSPAKEQQEKERLFDIKRWYLRALPLVGNGEMLAAVDADALVADVGWLLAHVEHLSCLLSAARCPDCDGSGGYMTGDGHSVPAELVQCQWCDERRCIDEARIAGYEVGHE